MSTDPAEVAAAMSAGQDAETARMSAGADAVNHGFAVADQGDQGDMYPPVRVTVVAPEPPSESPEEIGSGI